MIRFLPHLGLFFLFNSYLLLSQVKIKVKFYLYGFRFFIFLFYFFSEIDFFVWYKIKMCILLYKWFNELGKCSNILRKYRVPTRKDDEYLLIYNTVFFFLFQMMLFQKPVPYLCTKFAVL